MAALDRLIERRAHPPSGRAGDPRRGEGLVRQPVERVRGAAVRIRGRWVLNFGAVTYLGLNDHPQIGPAVLRALRHWGTFLGMPRLLAADPLTARLEQALAQLVGCPRALLFPSTTHVALDVLPLLAPPGGVLLVDQWAYPISVQGARLAAQQGARICTFPHDDAEALRAALRAHAAFSPKVIVCDGVYPATGRPAALRPFARLARAFGATLYVDDAHGVGLLGAGPTRARPYGSGGGGTPRHLDIGPGEILHVGSLSKAFGVPVAFAAGPAHLVERLARAAPSLTHSSPPAIATVAAALAALRVHAACGEARRARLLGNVRRFRRAIVRAGLAPPSGGLFPIQSIHLAPAQAAGAAARLLRQRGIWAVLDLGPPELPARVARAGGRSEGGAIRFVLSPRHTADEIDRAAAEVGRILGPGRGRYSSRV